MQIVQELQKVLNRRYKNLVKRKACTTDLNEIELEVPVIVNNVTNITNNNITGWNVSNWINPIITGGIVANIEPIEGIKFNKKARNPKKKAKFKSKNKQVT